MRNKIKFILMAFAICTAAFGISKFSNTKAQEFVNLTLSDIESLARYELPDAEITCGSTESKGRCWKGTCEPFYTPFGFAKAWDCDEATGNPNDVCVQGAPCV